MDRSSAARFSFENLTLCAELTHQSTFIIHIYNSDCGKSDIFSFRRSSFWISTLKRKNQCLKKVSNCICHNNSNPGSLGFNHIFLFPTKDFQKISEKQKGAMRRLWKVLWVKDERGAVRHRNLKSFPPSNWPNVSNPMCPSPTPINRGMFQSPCQQNIFYRGSDLLSFLLSVVSISHFGRILLLTAASRIKYKDGSGKI